MKYFIIIDNQRGFEYTSKEYFESALSFYRNPENGYVGRIQIIIE